MTAYIPPEVDTLFLQRAFPPSQLYSSAKDTSLFLVSTGMIFRNRYLLVLLKNTRKFCYSLQEHFNSYYSGLWQMVNSISKLQHLCVKVNRDSEGFWSLVPHTQFVLFLFHTVLKGSIRKHLNGGGADRLKTLIETPFPQCLPHKAAEYTAYKHETILFSLTSLNPQ